jgi:hypothetical protein
MKKQNRSVCAYIRNNLLTQDNQIIKTINNHFQQIN